MSEEKVTLEKIHRIAEIEFLKKGFKGASLRNIVKEAGVTTGAFYGYYKSKEELFDALVSPHAEYFLNYYDKVLASFTALSEEEQITVVSGFSAAYMQDTLAYAYQHLPGMKLLLIGAAGTKYEDFVHRLVEKEIQSTQDFMKVLGHQARTVPKLSFDFEHMIISGMFHSYFELIIHEVPYTEAKACAEEIYKFYSAGWAAVMGLE